MNLKQLSPAERAITLGKLSDTYVTLYPETKPGSRGRSRRKLVKHAVRFSTWAAHNLSMSEKTTYGHVKRYHTLGESLLREIIGTNFDTVEALDELAAMKTEGLRLAHIATHKQPYAVSYRPRDIDGLIRSVTAQMKKKENVTTNSINQKKAS